VKQVIELPESEGQECPCLSCPMEDDCLNDNTDIRTECRAYDKFIATGGIDERCH
jgi:hypothetical protein